jgi:hypothetical protein
MTCRFRTTILLSQIMGLLLSCPLSAEARSQWEIQHPTLPPQQDAQYMPGQMPGQLHKGLPAQLHPDFWKGQVPSLANRVMPGVVLTGVLEQELDSGDSKPGDVFSIRLDDGFVNNGMQVIPQKSKIVGAVTSVSPASRSTHGQPGSLQVSLQSLVLPDGTHIPFSGFIAVNPNHSAKNPPKQRNLGFDIKDTGNHVAGMLGSFTNGVGFMYRKKYRGKDFYLDKDELVPVRVNRTIIIPELAVKPVAPQAMAGQTAPGMVPGLAGQDGVGHYTPPVAPPPVPGLVGDADPFAVPINPGVNSKPLSEMPEPF